MLGLGLSLWQPAVYGSAVGLPNLLRNSSLVAADAGPPDVLPTYWSISTPREGAVRDIIATGTDQYPYMDIEWAGTASAITTTVLAQTDTNAGIAAAEGDRHTGALTVSLVDGDFTNVSILGLRIRYLNGGGSTLSTINTSMLGATSTPQRYTITSLAAPATTANIVLDIAKTWAIGPINFRLRLQGPMLNTGIVAATYQATSP